VPNAFAPKPAYDIALDGEALVVHLHKDFDANGRDHDWAQIITQRYPGPYARVTVDLSLLGVRVNSSFFSGLYRLHLAYGANGQPVVLRGANDRAVQGLEILALRPLFTLT
jgi:hypothetical protein